MSNKTISINPTLFNLSGSKTKKNREKKQKPDIMPLISPNVLKNKLLKRIKEHKQRETDNLENNKTRISNTNKLDEKDKSLNEINFSDEFSESINYLQTLSKQKKINDEKVNYDKQKQKRKEELERRTLKNHQSIYENNNNDSNTFVNLELPEELKINTEHFTSSFVNEPITIKDPVPYGILKGGSKPTYRDWSKTQRNNIVTNPNAALTIEGINLNKERTARESRLHNLREKLKNKQLEDQMQKNENIMMTQNLIQKPIETFNNSSIMSIEQPIPISIEQPIPISIEQPIPISNTHFPIINKNSSNESEKIIAIKKITKRTIKRKYTLGKSKMERKVGVLVKDRGTRKKVLAAQKELKRKPINDIKNYLRDHNLIKVGSNAPNDVIRKLFESAMLAGEITNSNSETLLHNFSKNDKEL